MPVLCEEVASSNTNFGSTDMTTLNKIEIECIQEYLPVEKKETTENVVVKKQSTVTNSGPK